MCVRKRRPLGSRPTSAITRAFDAVGYRRYSESQEAYEAFKKKLELQKKQVG